MSGGQRRLQALGRGVVALVCVIAIVALAWLLLVVYPQDLTTLLGIVLVGLLVPVALRAGSSVSSTLLPGYNVAEVAVEGPITRSADGGVVSRPTGADADAIVEQIEQADDGAAEALLVKLNTPGGEIVPSEDIRLAAERFDGPTVAYATDVCASGGYDIASGCDELWARRGSIVGSIGVIGSRVNVSDLADELGVSYEQFTAGEYKDAGLPLKDLSEDEREYLQGIVDDYYDDFVDTVAEGRGMDPERVRETEARIYLGGEAHDIGLVDEIGTREDVEDRLEAQLGKPVSVREFEPSRGLRDRIGGGAASVAYAFGAGIASVFDDTDGFDFRL
ncbi:signal peptide peptidase SppA [Halorientalis sp. IM1011]|uniref:signal peptide peptidase SppA n=1 Tax=Halorientalis sp. IM1011 TaxID=1932360 RepID=UPI00097CC44B|nr:signal peptide peptidase SppA [Halorientalis sp. IM1011]AQL41913.1 signal peptide peptidase SppA [Halorientalis sp. IM1011]